MNVTVLAALVGLAVVAAVVVLALLRRRRGSGVVLCGPSGGGKTALYFRLKQGQWVSTVSSLRENDGTFAWQLGEAGRSSSPIHTVDVPGHGRLRWRVRDFLPVSRALVFVIDATAVTSEHYIRDAAALLLEILAEPLVQSRSVSLCLACNKSDALLALPPKRIRALLEKEVSVLASTRAKHPTLHEGAEDAPDTAAVVGEGEAFSFEQQGIPLLSISAKKGDMKELLAFLKVA